MRGLLLLLAGCADKGGGPAPGDDTAGAPAAGVLVLAGGGSEGDEGDAGAWSAALYGRLLDGGDIDGDGLVRVAVLSTAEETGWLPGYLEWLGADEAFNLRLDSRAAAQAADLSSVDAVFLKGGDQGEYYDLWNDTALDAAIVDLHARGGGVGGTSAGAMSLAGYALAGGMDLISADVLADSQTRWLEDASDGGSGIHADFLGLLPDAVIDTHFDARGRLGRLAGAMAAAIGERGASSILGIGLEERTGLVIAGGVAAAEGEGAVTLLRPGASAPRREPGEPLVWADLTLDRLVSGWAIDLATGEILPAADAEPVESPPGEAAIDASWAALGGLAAHTQRFAWAAAWDPYSADPGSDPPLLPQSAGVTDAHADDRRAGAQEAIFRALYDRPGAAGFLVGEGGALSRDPEDPAVLTFGPEESGRELATLVLDGSAATWSGLAPGPAPSEPSLHAAAFAGLRLHVLAAPTRYDLASRVVEAE